MNREELEKIKSDYPSGTRVELIEMDDPQAPPIGTQGTVEWVDDIGSLCIYWDNGSTLAALHGIDKVRKL